MLALLSVNIIDGGHDRDIPTLAERQLRLNLLPDLVVVVPQHIW